MQALLEAELLTTYLNPINQNGVVKLLDTFVFRGHLCRAFELLEGGDLYQVR